MQSRVLHCKLKHASSAGMHAVPDPKRQADVLGIFPQAMVWPRMHMPSVCQRSSIISQDTAM